MCQLSKTGKSISKDDNIHNIYTDAHHSNPLRRVMPADFISAQNQQYAKEKYCDMLFEA